MTTLREAAEQALEALEAITGVTEMDDVVRINRAIPALRQALEASEGFDGCQHSHTGKHSSGWYAYWQCEYCGDGEPAIDPEQHDEPFGYFKAEPFGWTDCDATDEGAVALYDRPQPAQQPLTDEQLDKVVFDCGLCVTARDIARAIERAHGIGGEA